MTEPRLFRRSWFFYYFTDGPDNRYVDCDRVDYTGAPCTYDVWWKLPGGCMGHCEELLIHDEEG